MKKIRILIFLILFSYFPFEGLTQDWEIISEKELSNKLLGYWNGQLVGNYLGFPFENLYDEEPLPIFIDRYFDYRDADTLDIRMNINDRRAFLPVLADAMGGAWSDDDTDIEFVMLHGLEIYGLELNYDHVAELRKEHINRFIWASNAKVKQLLSQGVVPPATGSRENNEYWYALDGQLINEIWGAIYPGMVEEATEWSEWGARITNDEWAVHPTVFYGALYSAAFFETSIDRLIEVGQSYLPEKSPFSEGIEVIIESYGAKKSWQECRQLLHDKYFKEINGYEIPNPILGSIINGLNGVMALVYGEGDFMKTLGIAVTTGYDCDNQAATLGGLLGVMYGANSIPEDLTHKLPSRGPWSEPFNNTYINYSRDGLANYNTISGIVERLVNVVAKTVVAHGGKVEEIDGQRLFTIESNLNK